MTLTRLTAAREAEIRAAATGGPFTTPVDMDAAALELLAEIAALREELEDARNTVLNERGEGEPPEPGWVYNRDGGEWEHDDLRMWVQEVDVNQWEWGRWDCDESGTSPTARQGMKDATKYAKEHP